MEAELEAPARPERRLLVLPWDLVWIVFSVPWKMTVKGFRCEDSFPFASHYCQVIKRLSVAGALRKNRYDYDAQPEQ